MTSQRTPATPLALPGLFAGAVGIAFAPIFVRLSELGPSATAFWRIALALPVLALWMGLERRRPEAVARPVRRAERLRLLLAGLLFAGDLAVWHWSIQFTSVANATLLANFAPVFVTLGGYLFLRHRFTGRFLVGLVTALVGACVLMGASLQLSLRHLAGDGLGLLTAVFYASYILTVSELRARFSTATIMTWGGLACAPALLVVALATGESLLGSSPRGWWVLFGLAMVSQVAGQSLIAWALAHLPAAFSSVALLLQPVTAAILAWALLAEPLGGWQAAGGAVVLAGVFLARRGSATRPASGPDPAGS